jgi:DNA-binding GntR family transcriptional regulator
MVTTDSLTADQAVGDVAGAQPGTGETLADFAYTRLRNQLVTCEIRPGTTFSESEMAKLLRLGKTPIREAFLRLRLEGLIRVHSRTGYSAAPVTLKDARDVCALRGLLDGEAAFRAAEHPENAAQFLTARDTELAGYAGAGDVGAVIDSDGDFHIDVARTSGNDRLVDVVENVHLHFRRLAYLGAALDSSAPAVVHRHGELINAIGAGDGSRAREFAILEVREAEHQLIQAFISSHSVASANVSTAPPPQQFYLDIPKDVPESVSPGVRKAQAKLSAPTQRGGTSR